MRERLYIKDIAVGDKLVAVRSGGWGPPALSDVTVAKITKTQWTIADGRGRETRMMIDRHNGEATGRVHGAGWHGDHISIYRPEHPDVEGHRLDAAQARAERAVKDAIVSWQRESGDTKLIDSLVRELKHLKARIAATNAHREAGK